MGSECRARPREVARLISAAVIAFALAVPASLHAAEPSAADRETARALMKEGDRFLKENDATQALRAYSAAHRIMNVPPTGTAVVRALTQLGRLVEARDVALQVIRAPVQGKEPAVWVRAREEATAAAHSLEPRIAGLVVNVEGGRVEIDGVALADGTVGLVRKVDPGNHVVVVSAPGRKEAKLEVSLAEGETRELNIELEPVPEQVPAAAPPATGPARARNAAPSPAKPQPSRTVPERPASGQLLLIGGASAAALGVAVGAITGYLAIERSSDLRSSCPSAGCPPSRQDDYDSAHRLATVSNVAFAVGLVGIGVGAYGYYRYSTDTPAKTTGTAKAEVWPVAGLGVAGLGGRF